MSGSKVPLIYWDACVWIAYLFGEQRPNNEMAGVMEHVRMFEAGEALCVTSVITTTETPFLAGTAAEVKLTSFRQRRLYQPIEVSQEIAELAGKLRRHYHARPASAGGSRLATPDALHLATAIVTKCAGFYTFDGDCDPGDGSRRNRGLLGMSSPIAGEYDLLIRRPPPPLQVPLL